MTSPIPKNIIQTNLKGPSEKIKKAISLLFPKWNYQNFNEENIKDFFDKNPCDEFPNIYERYNRLKGAHRSDMFRYYYLYLKGGCYLDDDALFHVSIDNVIKNYDGIFIKSNFWKIRNVVNIFNGIICIVPKHKIIYEALKHIYSCPYDINNYYSIYAMFCDELYNIIFNKSIDISKIKIYRENAEYGDGKYESRILDDESGIIIGTHYFARKEIHNNHKIILDFESL
jgi:mannosyltransferase OCH1-like enzyme